MRSTLNNHAVPQQGVIRTRLACQWLANIWNNCKFIVFGEHAESRFAPFPSPHFASLRLAQSSAPRKSSTRALGTLGTPSQGSNTSLCAQDLFFSDWIIACIPSSTLFLFSSSRSHPLEVCSALTSRYSYQPRHSLLSVHPMTRPNSEPWCVQ